MVGVEREGDAGAKASVAQMYSAAARELGAGEQRRRDEGRKHGEGVKRMEAVKLYGERLEERFGHIRARSVAKALD